jgi:hypothetical protein
VASSGRRLRAGGALDDRTDTWQLGEPSTRRIRPAQAHYRRVELLDPAIQVSASVQQLAEDRSCQVGKTGSGDGSGGLGREPPRALR